MTMTYTHRFFTFTAAGLMFVAIALAVVFWPQ